MATKNVAGVEKFAPAAASLAVDEPVEEPAQVEVSGTSDEDEENPAFSRFWHVPEGSAERARNDVPEMQNVHVPESLDGDVPEDEVAHVPEIGAGWRIEVTNKGLYWTWRKGSHANRVSLKGGKFWNLSPERKQAYEQNKREYHNRKQQAQGRRGK